MLRVSTALSVSFNTGVSSIARATRATSGLAMFRLLTRCIKCTVFKELTAYWLQTSDGLLYFGHRPIYKPHNTKLNYAHRQTNKIQTAKHTDKQDRYQQTNKPEKSGPNSHTGIIWIEVLFELSALWKLHLVHLVNNLNIVRSEVALVARAMLYWMKFYWSLTVA